MSLARPLLDLGLRLTEKRALARETDPARLRARLERRVRHLFAAPRGVALDPGQLGRVPCLWLTPEGVAPDAPVLMWFHGGGYVFGSPRTHAHMVARLAQMAGLRACLPAYRLAPEHPFPAAPDDAFAAWEALIASERTPAHVLLGGDSAGGGLALSLLGRLCQAGGVLPAGLVAISPLTDLSFAGESWTRNARSEAMLPAARARDLEEMYLAGAAPTDPRASPLFADFPGAPPVWLTASDSEILLDDTRRIADALTAQGVAVRCEITHRLPHVWPFFWRYLPEGQASLRAAARWIRDLPPPPADS